MIVARSMTVAFFFKKLWRVIKLIAFVHRRVGHKKITDEIKYRQQKQNI